MICAEIDTLFFALFLQTFKSEFLTEVLISPPIVNENVTSKYKNLNLGVDD